MKKKQIIWNGISYLFLAVVALSVLLPLIYTVMGSFKSNAEILAHPDKLIPLEFTLDNYRKTITDSGFNIPQMLWNSIWYTCISVLIAIFMSTITGYVFARGGDFRGGK